MTSSKTTIRILLLVAADEENYSYCNRATNHSHFQNLNEKLNSCCHKDVRIAHISICSLRFKVDEMRCLQRQCKFEILAITEKHLDCSVSDAALNIEGMKFLRLDRKPRKGGSSEYPMEYLKWSTLKNHVLVK